MLKGFGRYTLQLPVIELCKAKSTAMAISAPLTQIAIMWTSARATMIGLLYGDPIPFLEAVRHSLCVWFVQNRPTELVANFAPLMVDPGIIRCARVHAYSDCNPFAWPSVGPKGAVSAYESTHDIRVVRPGAVSRIVELMEFAMNVIFL